MPRRPDPKAMTNAQRLRRIERRRAPPFGQLKEFLNPLGSSLQWVEILWLQHCGITSEEHRKKGHTAAQSIYRGHREDFNLSGWR